MAPCNFPIKCQVSLSSSTHITVVAAISTYDASVPPFLIYPGMYLMQDWTEIQDPAPVQMAVTADQGFSNTSMTIRWLKECFNPATKA